MPRVGTAIGSLLCGALLSADLALGTVLLQGTYEDLRSPSYVDLTTQGDLDWIYPKIRSDDRKLGIDSARRKNIATPLLSPFTFTYTGANYGTSATSINTLVPYFDWIDGKSPYQGGTTVHTALAMQPGTYNFLPANSYTYATTVAATAELRELKFYVGSSGGEGTLMVGFGTNLAAIGGKLQEFTAWGSATDAGAQRVYTIRFSNDTPAEGPLIVQWTGGALKANGNLGLAAITLGTYSAQSSPSMASFPEPWNAFSGSSWDSAMVPEPASAALLACLGASALLARRRRV